MTNEQFLHWTDLLIARGLAHADAGEHRQAYRYLELAVHELDDPERLSPRALALYGRAMAETQPGHLAAAVRLCRHACRADDAGPEPYEHLARILLKADARGKAVAAVDRGLRLEPDDTALIALRAELGRRRPPVVGFLPRAHPVNR